MTDLQTRPVEPDAIIGTGPDLPPHFWADSVDKLTLNIARRKSDNPVYGVQCPHGNRAVWALRPDQIGQRSATGKPQPDRMGGPLFYWGYATVCMFDCPCGDMARGGSPTDFMGNTPGWARYVDAESGAHAPMVVQPEPPPDPRTPEHAARWHVDPLPSGGFRLRRAETADGGPAELTLEPGQSATRAALGQTGLPPMPQLRARPRRPKRGDISEVEALSVLGDYRTEGYDVLAQRYPPKVVIAKLRQLHRRRLISYGVSWRGAWLEPAGRDRLRELTAPPQTGE